MKSFLKIQTSLTILIPAILWLNNAQQAAASFAYGAAIIWLNLVLLTWAWKNILEKKLVALSALTIVFKYAIFAVIVYYVISDSNSKIIWFVSGISSLMLTVIIKSVFRQIGKSTQSLENHGI